MNMKYFVVVLMFCAQGYLASAKNAPEVRQTIRDVIDEFLQRLKELLPNKIDIPDVDVIIPENDYVSGCVNLTDGYISGFQDFSIDVIYRGTIIPIPTGFDITINKLTSYQDVISDIQLINSSVLIYTNEATVATITRDVFIQGGLDFTILPLNFSVTNLDVHIGGIEFIVEGVVSSRFSEILSQILTEHVVKVVNRVLEVLSPVLVDIINNAISGAFNQTSVSYDEPTIAETPEKSVERVKEFLEALTLMLGLQT